MCSKLCSCPWNHNPMEEGTCQQIITIQCDNPNNIYAEHRRDVINDKFLELDVSGSNLNLATY